MAIEMTETEFKNSQKIGHKRKVKRNSCEEYKIWLRNLWKKNPHIKLWEIMQKTADSDTEMVMHAIKEIQQEYAQLLENGLIK